MKSVTPERHAWYIDSAVQREARLTEAAPLRGGFVSQPNSVTQNCTGPDETTWWSRTAACSSERILGRSPSSTLSRCVALPKPPPKLYG